MDYGDQKNLLSFSSYYWMGPTFQRNKEMYKHIYGLRYKYTEYRL